MTPLPKYTTPVPNEIPRDANTGLWFDKFCNTWSTTGDNWEFGERGKQNWLKTVTGKPAGTTALLTEHIERLRKLANTLGGTANIFSTTYRFATGLGREHPIENGFAWHQTLGTPYLPGSSVKGLVRAYANTANTKNTAEIARILGEQNRVGSVVLLDAIPAAPVPLKADVMTPHYSPYYQDPTGATAPGDWHSPVPVPFLTVAAGAKFLFTILPRTPSEADKADCQTAAQWLAAALEELGAGAKTATGYGRFKPEIATPAAGNNTPPPSQNQPHPLFAEIASATPPTAEQIVNKINALPDKTLQKQLAQKFLERTSGKDFKNARQKAAEKPTHWLNTLKQLTEQ